MCSSYDYAVLITHTILTSNATAQSVELKKIAFKLKISMLTTEPQLLLHFKLFLYT